MKTKRRKRYCDDCKKEAPPHYARDWRGYHYCCSCFLYWVIDRIWQKVIRENYASILCLYCLRKRLGRNLNSRDFSSNQIIKVKTPKQTRVLRIKMVTYA